MCAKSNQWLNVLNAIPGHILEGQDWETQGVVHSIRRDADDTWTWFSAKPNPKASSGVSVRKVCSGTAVVIWMQAKHSQSNGLTEADRSVLGLPTEEAAFRESVKDIIPGYVLAWQDLSESDVIYSVRRESENRWTWFETEYNSEAPERSVVRQGATGAALFIHRKARCVDGITSTDQEALVIPDEYDAIQDYEAEIVRLMPGINLGASFHRSLSPCGDSWTVYISVVRNPDGSWQTHVVDTYPLQNLDVEPETFSDPEWCQLEIEYEDAIPYRLANAEPDDVLRILYSFGYDIDDAIASVDAVDSVAAAELRETRPKVDFDSVKDVYS